MNKITNEIIADIIIGIDPGKSGGIAVWRPDAVLKVYHIPESVVDIAKILNYYKSIGKVLVFIEKVQLFMGDKDGKQFRIQKMLEQYEQLKTIMQMSEIPFIPVHAMSWQTYLKVRKKGEEKPDRKRRYKEIAQHYYPEVKATMWNCDAILLVEFGRRKKKYEPDYIQKLLPDRVFNGLI